MNGWVIEMAGVEHSTAPLEIRERFAFTVSTAQSAMRQALGVNGVAGCVVLSTCNRTELWLARTEDSTADAARLLCKVRGLQPEECAGRVTRRMARAAVRHLLETACGLHSRVYGEDQIISQVGAALALSRQCGCAGAVLEALFRAAVTAAKRVKTTVRLGAGDASAPARAVRLLEREFAAEGGLSGLECLVIGNGEMGRLAAKELLSRGCRVTMTKRSYKRGEVHIPAGCAVLEYERRYAALSSARIVFSATTSPHHTLHFQEAAPQLAGARRVLVDLAVPRDISARLGALENVRLYDIDAISAPNEAPAHSAEQLTHARAILEEELAAFEAWLAYRELWPLARSAGQGAARDAMQRTQRALVSLVPDEAARTELEHVLQAAVEQTTAKLLYGLRGLPQEAGLEECMRRMVQSAWKLPAQYALHAGQEGDNT